jgi:hypothetical protein
MRPETGFPSRLRVRARAKSRPSAAGGVAGPSPRSRALADLPTRERAVQCKFLHLLRDFSQ